MPAGTQHRCTQLHLPLEFPNKVRNKITKDQQSIYFFHILDSNITTARLYEWLWHCKHNILDTHTMVQRLSPGWHLSTYLFTAIIISVYTTIFDWKMRHVSIWYHAILTMDYLHCWLWIIYMYPKIANWNIALCKGYFLLCYVSAKRTTLYI